MTDPTMTFAAVDFARLLSNTVWATDTEIPILECVQLTPVTGGLQATATDRYVLARDVVGYADSSGTLEGELPIHRSDVARILNSLPEWGEVEVTWGSERLTVSCDWGSVIVKPFKGEYPRLAKLFELTPVSVDRICVDPERLAKFAAVNKRQHDDSMVLTFGGEGKAVTVRIGDTFVGLIMSRKKVAS